MALQIRRGLEADRSSITPTEGELLYVTDTKNIYVGDGSTAGGTLVTGDVINDTSPQLGGNLDLNGNDITGSGNINIDGIITATGNINLGDASDDNVSILGSLTTSLTPKLYAVIDVGSDAKRWRNGYFTGLSVAGQLDAESVNSNIIADDSTVSFNSATGEFNGTLDGDVTGSIFGDDSTLLVDSVNNTVVADISSATGTFTTTVTANEFVSAFGTITDLTSTDIFATEISADTFIANTNFQGTLVGTLNGIVDGDVNGSVFGDDSSILVDAVNNVLTGNIQTTNIDLVDQGRLVITKSGGNQINEVRLEAFQTRNRLNINTVDKTGDLSSYTGYYGTLNFGFEDSTTDRADATIRGAASDMRLAHDTVTALIDDETKYFTLKEGNFGFGTYTPTQKLDVRGAGVFTGDVSAAAFKGTLAADDSTIIIDGTTGGLIVANIDVIGETGNTPSTPGAVDSWLEITVNGAAKYIPLYD